MPSSRAFNRIVIAGASSLLGSELKSLLEESIFAEWDFRLLDEEAAAGTLTEAGGEAAVIQPVEEGSFAKARLIFFSGSARFTKANLEPAIRSGGIVVDLSGATAGDPNTVPWLPRLGRFQIPESADRRLFVIPSAAAEAIVRLRSALSSGELRHLTAVCFQPVSEAGRAGIEELETQTGQLLSFQSIGKALFDSQVAFNLLDRYGPQSLYRLSDVADRVRREADVCCADTSSTIAVQVLHVPVFYGMVFSAFAQLALPLSLQNLSQACRDGGFAVSGAENAPSNITAAGETSIQLAPPQSDSGAKDGWWFWGAADNIRLPAWNAVKLAEKLIQ